MTINELRVRLHNTKGNDDQFTAHCPAHDDRQSSLSVGLSEDRKRILLNCFAGCSSEKVMNALGLKMADLFIEPMNIKRLEVKRHIYEYHDAAGQLLYCKTRTDYDNGTKDFYFTQPDGTKGIKGLQNVPYNLPAVLEAQTVYFVEGEKCADAVIRAGRVATTLHNGANSKWLPEYAEYFKDKAVIIIPDNDEPGMKYARRISKQIPGSKVVMLPGLAPKQDVYDWLKAGHAMEELDALPAAIPPEEAKEEKEPRIPQAQILLELVKLTGAAFFHSDIDDLYAVIPVDQHTEIWALEDSGFKIWLNGLYYKETGKPVNNEAVGQAVAVLSAMARFDNPEPVTLSTRVAEVKREKAAIWYDLTNPAWQAVEITANGWEVHDNPPVLFTRYRHQAAQILPQKGGDVNKILTHINLKDQHTLFLCWLVSCFIPGFPHVMPIFYGEKGAAKSTTCALLKALIDPSALETLTIQSDPRALAVNLQQHWFLPFDNVSHINEETSDTLCRAITGGGIQQRKLYTNAEDTIFTYKRCLALNGINNVATRPDLLDRSLLIELVRIPETDRREMADILTAFEADRPVILGGILDTLVKAMEIFPSVKLDRLPRMADFARWGYAIGEALGGLGEMFLSEYEANRAIQNTEAINADPVATLIVALMNDREIWEGKVSELLSKLVGLAPEHGINTRSKGFPAQPNHLSRRVRGLKSNLESVGITCKNIGHGRQGTYISLKRENSSSPSSRSSQPANIKTFDRDDHVTINDDHILSSRLSSHPNPLRSGACDDGDGRDDQINTLRRGRI